MRVFKRNLLGPISRGFCGGGPVRFYFDVNTVPRDWKHYSYSAVEKVLRAMEEEHKTRPKTHFSATGDNGSFRTPGFRVAQP